MRSGCLEFIGTLNYFNGVKNHLMEEFQDLEVLVPNLLQHTFGFGDGPARTKDLEAQIQDEIPAGEKAHIFARSAGGIDARRLVSRSPEGFCNPRKV